MPSTHRFVGNIDRERNPTMAIWHVAAGGGGAGGGGAGGGGRGGAGGGGAGGGGAGREHHDGAAVRYHHRDGYNQLDDLPSTALRAEPRFFRVQALIGVSLPWFGSQRASGKF